VARANAVRYPRVFQRFALTEIAWLSLTEAPRTNDLHPWKCNSAIGVPSDGWGPNLQRRPRNPEWYARELTNKKSPLAHRRSRKPTPRKKLPSRFYLPTSARAAHGLSCRSWWGTRTGYGQQHEHERRPTGQPRRRAVGDDTVTPLLSTVGLNRLKSAFTPACPRRRTGTFAGGATILGPGAAE
jgi:hypothetical protein